MILHVATAIKSTGADLSLVTKIHVKILFYIMNKFVNTPHFG